jgi:hypothetical protein
MKCNGQQNVLMTSLQGWQNKTSDDVVRRLLTLFVVERGRERDRESESEREANYLPFSSLRVRERDTIERECVCV